MMLATLQALATLLAHDPLTMAEVTDYLGKVKHDYGANIIVTPHDTSFKEASVVGMIDHATLKPSGVPAHVVLLPVNPPTVEMLAQTFGKYKE
ncbi:MAG TPA: hypothetical protein VGK87_10510, partial [Anaerolineae bacterium]